PSGKRLLTSSTSSPEAFDVDTGVSLGKHPSLNGFSHAFFRDERVAVWTQRSHDFRTPMKGWVHVWDVVANADAGTFVIPAARFQFAQPARRGAELWLFRSTGPVEIDRIDCYDVAAGKLVRTLQLDTLKPLAPEERHGPGRLIHTPGNK